MKKDLLFNYIEHPESLGKESLPFLNDLVRQFPYCQTAQLLLVKCLSNEKSIHYNSQLKTAAAVVSNRTVLYNLLQTSSTSTSEIIIEDIVSPTFHISETVKVEETITEKPIQKQAEILTKKLPEKKLIIEEKEQASKVTKESKSKEDQELSPRNKIQKRLDEIEAERNKSNNLIQETLKPDYKDIIYDNNEIISTPISEQIGPETTVTSIIELNTSQVEKEELVIPISIEKEPPIVTIKEAAEKINLSGNKHTFTEWLKLREKNLGKKELDKTSEKTKKQIEIIDRFMDVSPKISHPKADFYKPSNMAKLSLEEHEDLVTETLAKIYFDQGNYSKALSSYEKLSLLFPEKSLIFASQITAIKNIINEK